MLAARERRERPGLDDKVLAAWNGLALSAFAEAARAFHSAEYLSVAEKNAAFLLGGMRARDGRMLRSWQAGQARFNGYLEDQVMVAEGLFELYQTTLDERWFSAARELIDLTLERYADDEGGFFDTSDDHEALIARPRSVQDGAVPSGGAVASELLVRMAALTGEPRYQEAAEAAIAPLSDAMARAPHGFARWLSALSLALATPSALAIIGPDPDPLLAVARGRYRPALVLAAADDPDASVVPLLRGRMAENGTATAYLCRHFACERPTTDAEVLATLLDTADRP